MADFNSCSSSQPPTTSFTLESEDISTLLHSLLHSSSSLPSNSSFFAPAAAASAPTSIKQVTGDSRCQFVGSAAFSDAAATCFDFPFSGCSYAPEDNERASSAFAGAVVSSSAGRDNDFDWESEKDHEASELLRHPTAPAKSSSKRSRPPDVHNLSEKRRRQKINEKMKALQKLIPNSNKTDKASMLDEAIEYLKQLQLQVQMLAMRNGSAVHPFYLSRGMHPTPSTREGTSFNEGDGVPTCTGQGLNSVMASEDMPFTSSYVPLNQGASSSQKEAVLPQQPVAGSKGSGRPVGVELSAAPHCKPFAFHMASKGLLCNDSKLPQLELDMSRFGDDSSSGVSS